MLEGKVGDFSLPEIFQLIALTKKTGTLTISTHAQQGRVRFRDGEVSEAAADVRRQALGARLVAAGLVDESQLAAALEAKRDQGGEVLELLLEHAAIDEGALHAFVREQIADAVADLLRMDDASFRFDSEDAPPEPLIDVHVASDQLVTEGNQRLAEWDAIRRHVPARGTVFAANPGPLAVGEEVVVNADDWQVLALVDGRRPVGEIVELSGRSEFSTSKALAGLAARKLVEPCGDDDDGHPLSSLLARREVLRRLEELELSEIQPGPPQPVPGTERSDPEPASKDPASAQDVEDTTTQAQELPADLDLEAVGQAPAPGGTVPPAPSFEGGIDHDRSVGTGSDALAAPEGAAAGTIDRAQVARELAALGLDEAVGAKPSARAAAAQKAPAGQEEAPAVEEGSATRRLVRDEEFNKGLLLRLIDGVKGA